MSLVRWIAIYATLATAAPTATIAEEYFGITWSSQQTRSIRDYGYDPKYLSQVMYESGKVCSRVTKVYKKKELVCVNYKCGYMGNTFTIVINTWLDKLQSHQSFCHW